jgi:hypothetical protein
MVYRSRPEIKVLDYFGNANSLVSYTDDIVIFPLPQPTRGVTDDSFLGNTFQLRKLKLYFRLSWRATELNNSIIGFQTQFASFRIILLFIKGQTEYSVSGGLHTRAQLLESPLTITYTPPDPEHDPPIPESWDYTPPTDVNPDISQPLLKGIFRKYYIVKQWRITFTQFKHYHNLSYSKTWRNLKIQFKSSNNVNALYDPQPYVIVMPCQTQWQPIASAPTCPNLNVYPGSRLFFSDP